jgi:hypothetical protein
MCVSQLHPAPGGCLADVSRLASRAWISNSCSLSPSHVEVCQWRGIHNAPVGVEHCVSHPTRVYRISSTPSYDDAASMRSKAASMASF